MRIRFSSGRPPCLHQNEAGIYLLRLIFTGILFFEFSLCNAQFALYNSIHYPGMPSVYSYAGNTGSYAPYLKGFLLDYNASVGGSSAGTCTPNPANIQQFATEGLKNPAWPVSFDMEINWPTSGTALTDSANNYVSAVNIFKSTNSQSPISFYGLPPYPDAWKWSGVSGSSTFENVSKSAAFVSIANAVDYFSPSLYAYSTDDTVTWRKYADTMINTIRKYYSATKPIYPYIWPQWHDHNNTLMDTASWYYELNYLYNRAQGAIIWSGGTYNWDGNAAWWQTTKKFMARKGLVPPVVADSFYIKNTSLGGNTTLRWLTSTDTVTKYFQVEKSTDNITYSSASGQIAKSGGNYTMNAYEFTDTSANATTVYYRLKSYSTAGVTRYLDTIQVAVFKSTGAGVNVDLSSSANWLENVNGTWVAADTMPASLNNGLVYICSNDTWNNASTAVIGTGVIVIDSAATLNATASLQNRGKVIFCGTAAQTIPGTAYLSGSTWGTIEVNNTSGVTATQSSASNFMRVGILTLTAGTFTVSASGGKSVSLYVDSTVTTTGGNLTVANSGGSNYGPILDAKSTQRFANGTFLNNTIYVLTISNPTGFTYGGPLTVSSNLHISLGTTVNVSGNVSVGGLSIDTITGTAPLQSSGSATVGGALSIGKFKTTPYIGQVLTIIQSADGISGSFSSVTLPTGYTGTTSVQGNNLVLTVTGTPNSYKSAGTGVSVDLSSAANWLVYQSGSWVAATSAPSTLDSGSIVIQAGDTWNNASTVTIPATVTIVQQGNTGTFAASGNLNIYNSSLVYSGASAQTIPSPTAFSSRTVSNLTIDNAAGVTLNAGSYFNIRGTLTLSSGNFVTYGGSGLYLYGPLVRTGGSINFPTIGFDGSSAQTIYDSVVNNSLLYINNSAGVTAVPDARMNVTTLGLQKGNLILSNGDSLKISSGITYTAGGIVSASASVVAFTGTSAQSIPSGTFISNAVNNLAISNAQGVSATGNLSVQNFDVAQFNTITPLTVSGTATVSGSLTVDSIQSGISTDTVVSAGAVSGTFSSLDLPAGYTGSLTYTSSAIILSVSQSAPLAIRSVALTGNVADNTTSLHWKVAGNNIKYFEVQRSADGVHFATLSTVGASTDHFVDNDISPENYYRVIASDNIGNTLTSNILNLNGTVSDAFTIFPNPANNGSVTLSYTALAGKGEISILNINGNTVLKADALRGTSQKILDVSKLPGGIYFVVLSENGKRREVKLIIR